MKLSGMSRMTSVGLVLLGIVGVTFSLISSPSAQAVTFGADELLASEKYPWAVPILYFEKNEIEPAGFCTGTLIKPDVILTAAHCVPPEGHFEIKYGISTFEESNKNYVVKGAWRHPRYSASKFGVNDIGLLKLKEPIIGAGILPLVSAKALTSAEMSKDLRILGWGENQNGEMATYLRSAKLTNQNSFLSKILGKRFNKETWFAAGKYNSTEKVYAGGCRGDSGGPLVANVKGKLVQVGITSFGAENCETAAPTIFMKVSYFLTEINSAIRQLGVYSADNDRSPPKNLVSPTILGTVRVGGQISCLDGSWTPNVTSFSYEWSSSNGALSSSQKSILITQNMSGYEVTCDVIGNAKSGTLTRSVSVSVPAKPVITTEATLIGMPKSGYDVGLQNSITCQGGIASGEVESSTFYWVLRDSSYSTTGTNVGNSQTLTLPSTFFQTNSYKDLACVNVISGPGGEVRAQANSTIYAPAIPSVYSVSKSGFNSYWGSNADAWIGTTLTCSASTSLPAANSSQVSYSWRIYSSVPGYYPTDITPSTSISTGATLLLTEAILKQAVLKYIGCAATVTTLSGSATGYSSPTYVDYKNISAPDLAAPTFSLVTIAPYNGPAFRLRDPFSITLTAGDASGLGTYPFSFRAIVDGASEVSMSSNGSMYTYPGGTSLESKFQLSFILPGIASGGKFGSYEILVFVTDSKGNSTGWKSLTTFIVAGERTD